MQELARSDIFFLITSVAVIVLAVGSIVVVYYVVGILREIRFLSRIARLRGREILDELRDASYDLHRLRLWKIIRLVRRLIFYKR